MIITSPNHVHVERHASRHRPAAQTMMHHLAIQLPNHRSLKVEIADEKGARGYVDDGAGKRFVERRVAVAEASEAGTRTQGGLEGGAESEEGILGCVVVVDCRKLFSSNAPLKKSTGEDVTY